SCLALRRALLQTSAILPMLPRRRRKDSRLLLLAFPSPAKRGKVPTAGAGAPANSGAGPKGERQDGASQADGGAPVGRSLHSNFRSNKPKLPQYRLGRLAPVERRAHDQVGAAHRIAAGEYLWIAGLHRQAAFAAVADAAVRLEFDAGLGAPGRRARQKAERQ